MANYYKILGVEKSSDAATIKAAYRKLALKYHPDKNLDDESAQEKFKKISEAYSVLSDPAQRRQYDSPNPYGSSHSHSPDDIFRHFETMFGGDIFDNMFNRRRQAPRGPTRGANINVDVHLTFLEAALGCTKSITFERPEVCGDCSGAGYDTGMGLKTCSVCEGTGQLHMRQGMMVIQLTCNSCGGHGAIPIKVCTKCAGSGLDPIIDTVNINIPVGVMTGQKLRVSQKGLPGNPPGDAIVRVLVQPSDKFIREDLDIHTTIVITAKQAILGCHITSLETIYGTTSLTISPGTQPGESYTLTSAGIRHHTEDVVGNQIVHVNVKIPTNLSEAQRNSVQNLPID